MPTYGVNILHAELLLMDSTRDKSDRRELVRENPGSAWSVLWISEHLGLPDPSQRNAASEILGPL